MGTWKWGAKEALLSPRRGTKPSCPWQRTLRGRTQADPHLRDGVLELANQAPVRMRLNGSHDGRFWYELGRWPVARAEDLGLADGSDPARLPRHSGSPTQ